MDAMILEQFKFWLRLLFSDPNPEILAILTFLMIMACDRLPWLQPLVKTFWWLIWTCLRYQTCSSWSGVSNARWIMISRCLDKKRRNECGACVFFGLDYSFQIVIPRPHQLVLCGHLSLWSTLFTLTARKKFLVGPIDMFETSNLFYMIREIKRTSNHDRTTSTSKKTQRFRNNSNCGLD